MRRFAAFAVAACLLLWAAGWSSSVVISGSMSPAVEAGDIVITFMTPHDGLRAGQVVRFRDPRRTGRSILHRIVRVDEHGMLITKGDANDVADAAPVPRSAVTGVQRLRIPYAGLPALWWLRGRHWPALLIVAALLLLMSGCRSGGDRWRRYVLVVSDEREHCRRGAVSGAGQCRDRADR